MKYRIVKEVRKEFDKHDLLIEVTFYFLEIYMPPVECSPVWKKYSDRTFYTAEAAEHYLRKKVAKPELPVITVVKEFEF